MFCEFRVFTNTFLYYMYDFPTWFSSLKIIFLEIYPYWNMSSRSLILSAVEYSMVWKKHNLFVNPCWGKIISFHHDKQHCKNQNHLCTCLFVYICMSFSKVISRNEGAGSKGMYIFLCTHIGQFLPFVSRATFLLWQSFSKDSFDLVFLIILDIKSWSQLCTRPS